MLGNSNYVDITGQIEEVFDEKIQQINFLTEDNVKDKIEEAVAEIEIKPEIFDDVYAKIDHTHTSFNNLVINGKICSTDNRYLEVPRHVNFTNETTNWKTTLHNSENALHVDMFDDKGKWITKNTLCDASGNALIRGSMTVSKDLSVGGLTIIPNPSSKNNVMFNINGYNFWNCNNNADLFTIYKNLSVNMNLNVSGNANINGELNAKAINSSSLQVKGTSSFTDEVDIQDSLTVDKDLVVFGAASLENATITGKLTVKGKEITGNETITHITDEIQGEIGTFCETNGGIYTGYDKIAETDCICQVQQSNTLNPKIVGIITDKDQFASHGDVLVKIVPGTYHLGDILCPDISGKARKATETELQYMMLHAIPRAKITSLDTKIEGTVACFIV